MPVKLEMRIGGGYAFVDRTPQQFDIASITPNGNQKLHRLTVRAKDDVTSAPKMDDPLDPQNPALKGLDLNTRHVRMEIWPGSVKPNGKVVPPHPDDRAELLPDVAELGRSPLAANWRQRIAACITLRTGTLKVDHNELAKGRFEFRHPTKKSKPIQQMANGLTGLHYSINITDDSINSIVLNLYPLATPDLAILGGVAPVAAFVLTPPSSGVIKLQVDAIEPPKDMTNGMDLEEFGVFYNLLNPVTQEENQWIPRWYEPEGGLNTSPGSECPPGYYDDLNP